VPVLVDFWAEWCGPCREAAPSVEAAAREFSGQVTIAKLNIDQNKRTSTRYSVRGIPTFLLFRDGHVIGRQTGFGGKQALFAFIRQYL
jgi:thioredoxin 1